MSECVATSNVIRALKAHKVFVALVDEKTQTYTIEHGSFMETVVFTPKGVGKRYLQRLKRKLNVPIHHFWNPEQAEAEENRSE